MRPAFAPTERTCTRKNGTATESSVVITIIATRISMRVKPECAGALWAGRIADCRCIGPPLKSADHARLLDGLVEAWPVHDDGDHLVVVSVGGSATDAHHERSAREAGMSRDRRLEAAVGRFDRGVLCRTLHVLEALGDELTRGRLGGAGADGVPILGHERTHAEHDR